MLVEAIRGNFADGIHSVAQQLPERCRVVRAGKPAADADDGDRFVVRLPILASPGRWLRHVR